MDSLTSPVLAGMVNRKAEVSIVGAADARLHLFLSEYFCFNCQLMIVYRASNDVKLTSLFE